MIGGLGLLADLGHICAASGVGAEIDASLLPRSSALLDLFDDTTSWDFALSGGDDYELLFCLRPGQSVKALSRRLGLPVSRIGRIAKGHQVKLLGRDGMSRLADGIAGWNQLREH